MAACAGHIAVVVIFQRRSAYVDQCLEAIANLRGGPWPLILVGDEFVPAYEQYGTQVVDAGGISHKRNVGAAAAPQQCRFIAYVDSDAFPQEDWLVQARQRLEQSDASLAAVTGPALTPPQEPWLRRICGWAMASPLIMGPQVSGNYDPHRTAELVQNASTCNLVVRRDVLERLGGFDESLRTSEDVALSNAIVAAGMTILRDPAVVVYHHRRDLVHFWMQWFNEGLSLKQRGTFNRAGAVLVWIPSLFVIAQAVLAGLGLVGLLAMLQGLQLIVFLIDRKLAKAPWLDSLGAAVAMWGFPIAYGIGGIASFLGGCRLYLASRNDPQATAADSLARQEESS
ncbi:MAG: glycosyltransferase [Planctomycetaceae bacterium]|nr:hypothetical protein [Planctomycetaceae bacterium]